MSRLVRTVIAGFLAVSALAFTAPGAAASNECYMEYGGADDLNDLKKVPTQEIVDLAECIVLHQHPCAWWAEGCTLLYADCSAPPEPPEHLREIDSHCVTPSPNAGALPSPESPSAAEPTAPPPPVESPRAPGRPSPPRPEISRLPVGTITPAAPPVVPPMADIPELSGERDGSEPEAEPPWSTGGSTRAGPPTSDDTSASSTGGVPPSRIAVVSAFDRMAPGQAPPPFIPPPGTRPEEAPPADAPPVDVASATGPRPRIAGSPSHAFALAAAVATLALALGALYHRIARHEVLDQETRHAIYKGIRDDPGVRVGTLAARLGLSHPTVARHIRILVRFGLVETVGDGQRRLFATGTIGRGERLRCVATSTPLARAIVGHLRTAGPTPGPALRAALALPRSTASTILARLERAGLIVKKREGRTVVVTLAPPR